jgi:two-component system response regulator MprA
MTSPRLLVVDDDPDVRDSLSRALRYAGYQVLVATHGGEALVLTARDSVDDRVTGLDAGADDYLVKPFALGELQARVRALLRRSQARRDVLGYADLTLDANARRVTRDGQEIVLTRMEFGLLELLLRNAEQVLSYDVIRERVWGYGEAPMSNALTVFVGFLRRKLEAGGRPRLLHNVRGVGYVIRALP